MSAVSSKKRVTLRDIAKECGCTVMTVSYALRHYPRISQETREKVQSVALKMGYMPDPALSALSAYRRVNHPHPAAAPLAWITNYAERDGQLSRGYYIQRHLNGAAERAREMGYRIETFWLRESGMTARRMSQILYNRGITGVLLPPQPRPQAHLNLDWEKFCVVTFGYSLARPRFHMVATHHFRAVVMLVRRLRAYGYRRIGLHLSDEVDTRVAHAYSASFSSEQSRFRKEHVLPILRGRIITVEDVRAWIRRYRPEAIITWDPRIAGDALKQEGLRAPDDIGLATLFVDPMGKQKEVSGIDENYEAMGAAASDLLVMLMQQNERGVPIIPRSVLIDAGWFEGTTVRRLHLKAPRPF